MLPFLLTQKSIKIEPNQAHVFHYRGIAHDELGNYNAAVLALIQKPLE